jgi:D-arabinose 1-dehydrogenase-like Zn-dependent alcohol dehydrogenase
VRGRYGLQRAPQFRRPRQRSASRARHRPDWDISEQYARQMGFKTVALGRGKDKAPLAKKLGAHHYIDSAAGDAVAELQKLGGARVILATAPNAKAISALVDGLSADGKLHVPAAPNEPLAVSMMQLIAGRRSVAGGTPARRKIHRTHWNSVR